MTTPGSKLRLGSAHTAIALRDGSILAVKPCKRHFATVKPCKRHFATVEEWRAAVGVDPSVSCTVEVLTEAQRLLRHLRKDVSRSVGTRGIYIYPSPREQLAQYKSQPAGPYWDKVVARIEGEIAAAPDRADERRSVAYGNSYITIVLDGTPTPLSIGRVITCHGVPTHPLMNQIVICINGRLGTSLAEVGVPAGTPLWVTQNGHFRRLEGFA